MQFETLSICMIFLLHISRIKKYKDSNKAEFYFYLSVRANA